MTTREEELVKTTAFFGIVAAATSVIAAGMIIDRIVAYRANRKITK